MSPSKFLAAAALACLLCAVPALAQTSESKYFRVGSAKDAQATSTAGFALMGGGTDLDEAFRFLCDRAGHGDLLVLRSHGGDAYNPWLQTLCKLNSVATLVIPSRAAANEPFVAQTIAHASALFIAGGDQGEYIQFWMHTPVQDELNRAIARGVPIGGTSAGLAVLGQFIYTSLGDKPNDPNLDGKTAMLDPFGPRITLDRDLLDIPLLRNIVTDTHFARRDRMGRLLTFLARLNAPDGKPGTAGIRGIGIEERAAVLLEPDGTAKVVGYGAAYFVDAAAASGALGKGQPLSFGPYNVQKVAPGHSFNLKSWTGDAVHYTLTVKDGALTSSQPGGSAY